MHASPIRPGMQGPCLPVRRFGTFPGGPMFERRNVACRGQFRAMSQTEVFSDKGSPAGD